MIRKATEYRVINTIEDKKKLLENAHSFRNDAKIAVYEHLGRHYKYIISLYDVDYFEEIVDYFKVGSEVRE